MVTAHPDDVDFGAAGTVALLGASGATVSYCVVTDGTAGGFDRSVGRDEIAAIRRREQRSAAAHVNVTDVVFLGRQDGAVVADFALRRAIAREIRRVQPELVITQSPERNYERLPASHPDHRAVGDAALSAVYPDARNPFAFPELLEEGLEPHIVPEVWLMAHPEPTLAVDVTAVLETKFAAIGAHESQLPDPEQVRRRVASRTAHDAVRLGLNEGSHAEVFKVIRLD